MTQPTNRGNPLAEAAAAKHRQDRVRVADSSPRLRNLLPDDKGAWIGEAHATRESKRPVELESVVAAVHVRFPKSFAPAAEYAGSVVQNGRDGEAIDRWQAVKFAFPDNPASFDTGVESAVLEDVDINIGSIRSHGTQFDNPAKYTARGKVAGIYPDGWATPGGGFCGMACLAAKCVSQ